MRCHVRVLKGVCVVHATTTTRGRCVFLHVDGELGLGVDEIHVFLRLPSGGDFLHDPVASQLSLFDDLSCLLEPGSLLLQELGLPLPDLGQLLLQLGDLGVLAPSVVTLTSVALWSVRNKLDLEVL